MKFFATVVLCSILGLALGQDSETSNPTNDPCQSETYTVQHETQCDAYYECFDGHPRIQNCPNGLVYSGKSLTGLLGVCDYPHNHDCTDRPVRNSPISNEQCEWLYGIFGHQTSCTRYVTCWNGTATEQFCIGGLLYNEETHSCDWPQNVEGCQKHPLCKEDPNANVPLGQSCERYWSCQGGYPRLQRCPATLVFDKNTRRCVNPPTEDCDIPLTTPHPESDQPSNPQSRVGGGPPRRNLNRSRRPQQEVEYVDEPAIDQPVDQYIDEPVEVDARPRPRPNQVENRPRRPNFPNLPSLPQGAIPVNFGDNRNRPPPIEGAIPLN